MQQAWNIFRKDLRGLRVEVVFLVALALGLGWAEARLTEPDWVEWIALLAVNYTIARLIHQEAIPGTNQFWITRPYRWKSLLVAKLLFILLCIQLPMLLAQIYMIVAGSFPFVQSLPGLVWSQILMFFCAWLPAACLASLTTGLVTFLFSELVLVAMGFVGAELIGVWKFPVIPAMQWVRNSFAAVVIAGFAASLLFLHYRNRKTGVNRGWAGAGLALAGFSFLFTPWSFALTLQSWLSKQDFDSSAMSASLETIKQSVFPIRGSGQTGPSEVNLPIAIRGIPAGLETTADAVFVTLTAADGQIWSSDFVPSLIRPDEPGTTLLNAELAVDPLFFERESARPVMLRAALYLTLFGDSGSMTIPIEPTPVNIMDGLQCSEGVFIQFSCRAVFRWPARRVYAAANGVASGSSFTSISYSPFPAELGFGAPERHSFSLPYAASRVTITTKEPLGHFRADLTIPNVVLARFTKEEKRKFDHGVTGTE